MMKDQEWREITSLNSSLLHKMNLSMVLLENKITSWKRGVMDLCISLSCCPSYQRNCQVDNLLKLRQKVIDQKNLLRRKDSTNCGNHLGKWIPFELAIPWDLENHLNYSFTLPRHSRCFENQCKMEFDFKLHKWFVLYNVSPRCVTMFASKNLLDITFPKFCLLLYD